MRKEKVSNKSKLTSEKQTNIDGFFIIDPGSDLIKSLIKSSVGREYLDRLILENAPISIMVIDTEGKIVAVNKYFLRFTGSSSPVGRLIDNVEFFKRENLTDAYYKLVETGKHFSREDCQTVNKSGDIIFLNILAVPLRNLDGKIEGIISIATDNTEARWN